MFGALLRNENTEAILDSNSYSYYPQATGPAKSLFSADEDYLGANQRISTDFPHLVDVPVRGNSDAFLSRPYYAATSLLQVGNTVGGVAYGWIPSDNWLRSDICFWRPGTMGLDWICAYWSFAHSTTNGYARTMTLPARQVFFSGRADPTITSWRPTWLVARASTTLPSTTQTHGLQLLNTSGQVTYDSRRQHLPIVHVHIVSAAELDDVLTNNTTKTITLPFAIPNAYIHTPNWISFRREAETAQFSSVYAVRLAQTNSTTITLSRVLFTRQGRPSDPFRRDGCWTGLSGTTLADGPATDQGAIQHQMDTPLFFSPGPVVS